MADDLGWGDISAHGGGVATPNIDRLFRQYATDWVEFDIAFSLNTPKRDPFYSPMRGNDSKPASLLLRKGVGIDQHGREQANGPGPRDPASPWEHRIIGLCANAPGL